MKTLIRLLLGALVGVAPVWMALGADGSAERRTGHVLLLQNEHLIEGNIERDGDHYRVKRVVGETLVAADTVLCLCETRREAYRYLRSCANLRDVDERLRLARWCHLYGLQPEALSEAAAAVELRPSSSECRGLLESMQRAAAVKRAMQAAAKPVVAEENTSLPPIEISADTMGLFISKVQPILMNTCASCHLSGRGGKFQLLRAEGGSLNHRATQHNLNAVLAQLNLARWQTSPLLLKAVSVHGGTAQPPLKNRQSPAFRTIEDWVRMTMADNPQLEDHSIILTSAENPKEGRVIQAAASSAPGATQGSTFATQPTASSPAATPVLPADPFDPAIFNQGHARKGKNEDR